MLSFQIVVGVHIGGARRLLFFAFAFLLGDLTEALRETRRGTRQSQPHQDAAFQTDAPLR
jgi:hypothetical protein